MPLAFFITALIIAPVKQAWNKDLFPRNPDLSDPSECVRSIRPGFRAQFTAEIGGYDRTPGRLQHLVRLDGPRVLSIPHHGSRVPAPTLGPASALGGRACSPIVRRMPKYRVLGRRRWCQSRIQARRGRLECRVSDPEALSNWHRIKRHQQYLRICERRRHDLPDRSHRGRCARHPHPVLRGPQTPERPKSQKTGSLPAEGMQAHVSAQAKAARSNLTLRPHTPPYHLHAAAAKLCLRFARVHPLATLPRR